MRTVFSAHYYLETFQGLCLGFPKSPYFWKFIHMATRDKPLKDLVGVWPIFGYKFWIQILHSDLERGGVWRKATFRRRVDPSPLHDIAPIQSPIWSGRKFWVQLADGPHPWALWFDLCRTEISAFFQINLPRSSVFCGSPTTFNPQLHRAVMVISPRLYHHLLICH